MPAVLLISFHFHPAPEVGGRRTTALAEFLVSKGVRVLVVSAFGNRDISPGSEILPGIVAFPVKRPRRILIDSLVSLKRELDTATATPVSALGQGAGFSRRLKRFAHAAFFRIVYFMDQEKRWSWSAASVAVRAGKRYGASVVLSSSPPNSVLLAGTFAARRLRVPHVADFRDPWTDAAGSDLSRRLERMVQLPLEAWVVNSSARITSTAAAVAESLKRRYPCARASVHVIRNGYDGEFLPQPSETGGRLSILFAGELYLGRTPLPLLEALETLVSRPDVNGDAVRVTFMGAMAGCYGRLVTDWLAGKQCARLVKLLPQMPPEAVAEATRAATVLLNLAQQQPFSVPAKTYEHLICGREMLLLCEDESETARIVKGIRGVNQVDPRYPGVLEGCLLDLYRRHVIEGRMRVPTRQEVQDFSRAAANQTFWSIIGSVATLGERAPASSIPAREALELSHEIDRFSGRAGDP